VIDRFAPRNRPSGLPVLHQRWCRLLFLHWPVPPEAMRPHVPPELKLDLFDDKAWVGLTVFSVSRMRPSFLPPIPMLSDADEINLRTYVHCGGVPGLWFFSLDANNRFAVCAARLSYHLPYFRARMQVEATEHMVTFKSERVHPGGPSATFDGAWHLHDQLPEAQPGTRAFFLIERYVLYTLIAGALCRARIHHRPWPLRGASVGRLSSTMLEAAGLPTPQTEPLIHAQARPFDVSIWPPQRVAIVPSFKA
jgi:uncharacterized protein YqjF (DUF2071 family)